MGFGFSGLNFDGWFHKPGFHWDKYFSKELNSKKKKLTDIGFLLVFPGLVEKALFNGFGFLINVC